MAGLRLEVTVEGSEGPARVFHLTGRDAFVGRDPACDLALDAASVSSRHGLFRALPDAYAFVDLGSRNGTRLHRGSRGDAALPRGEQTVLEVGDILLLGAAGSLARVEVRAGVRLSAPLSTETLSGGTSLDRELSRVPLLDPLSQGAHTESSAWLRICAELVTATSLDALGQAAMDAFARALPGLDGAGLSLQLAGQRLQLGAAIPRGLSALANDAVLVLEQDTLPLTTSVATTGARVAVVVPLRRPGPGSADHGLFVGWTRRALPERALELLAALGPVVALAASAQARPAAAAPESDPVAPFGASLSFRAAVELARAVAGANVPVLLEGETGTGKEVMARAVHRWSPRAAGPFVAFNCAAIPESLFESELFGHVRGAFTGAIRDRAGLFEEAHGGTLFLDEIGELPLAMQPKLLRILQDGEVRRVGATRSEGVDVRVVSASHRDLPDRVARGLFRQDLLYRLNTVTVRLPPLRERGDDVVALAHLLLGRVAASQRKVIPGFTREAARALAAHPFPGNIRELENELVRAVALTPEHCAIDAPVFSFAPRAVRGEAAEVEGPSSLRHAVEVAERRAIRAALERRRGNVSQAARDLELTRPGLYKVLERLGIRLDRSDEGHT